MRFENVKIYNAKIENLPHLVMDYMVVAGGGGGGAGGIGTSPNAGASGGSGTVIVRYPGSTKGTGGTITPSAGDGYTYHTFTAPGTFTITSIS